MATSTLALLGQAAMARSSMYQQQQMLGQGGLGQSMHPEIDRFNNAVSFLERPVSRDIGIREELQSEVDEWLKPVK